jgi:hypothetical protein
MTHARRLRLLAKLQRERAALEIRAAAIQHIVSKIWTELQADPVAAAYTYNQRLEDKRNGRQGPRADLFRRLEIYVGQSIKADAERRKVRDAIAAALAEIGRCVAAQIEAQEHARN